MAKRLMRVKLVGTGQCFASASECDRSLGLADGTVRDTIQKRDGFHKKRNLQFEVISEEEYQAYISSPDYMPPTIVERPKARRSADGGWIKICRYCKQEFVAHHFNQSYCDREHHATCEICGKDFIMLLDRLVGRGEWPTTCSPECAQKKSEQTCQERYGVAHPTQSPVFLEKSRQTSRAHYGVDNPAQSQEVRQKMEATSISRTGYKCTFSDPAKREEHKAILMTKYGVEHPLQSPDILAKMHATNREKYGVDVVTQSPEIQQKVRETNIERYGATTWWHSEAGRARLAEIYRERYGVAWYPSSEAWARDHMRDLSKWEQLKSFRASPRKFIQETFDHAPTLHELADVTGITSTTVGAHVLEAHCEDLVTYVFSMMELEVTAELKKIDPSINILPNTKRIITPYEIDIYLPDYRVGIECNPTSTHNSSINLFNRDEAPTSIRYHMMKSDLALQKGVFLFHIFGYEWTHRRDVVVSMLRNLMNKNIRKIGARTTHVIEVDAPTAANFLEENHRQGKSAASVCLGLQTDEGELVSVMTFSRPRSTIGVTSQSNTWELARFANLRNTSVMGGASKLLRHFESMLQPAVLKSYSDVAHTRGSLYQTLGFVRVNKSEPGYVWVRMSDDRAFHRLNAQKRNIRKFLRDDSIDIEHMTEAQIMESHGFVRVYDSGTILWEKHYP